MVLLLLPFALLLLVIIGGGGGGGDAFVAFSTFPLLVSVSIERKYALDFVWNILTFIGIARKFNQKFYSSSSGSKSFANTIHYE